MFILFICMAQTIDWKNDQDVLDAVDAKIEAYKARKLRDCKRKALEEATTKVDSLLKASTGQLKKDSVRKPLRPIRPNTPSFEVTLDSTPVVPIIN